MAKRLLYAAGLAMAISAVHAADDDGRFSIRGAGLLNCETYVKEREARSKAYYMIGGWLDGYITGRNQFSPDTYDVTSFESTELLALILAEHCNKNPGDRLFSVVHSIFTKYEEDRVREGSPFVTVEVNERKTSLYRETMRRAQRVLKERKHYYGEIDGEFGPMMQLAIERFQREQEMNPTGFPDQSTLWRLFRGEPG